MDSNASLKVEFLAGTNLKEAVAEAKEKAVFLHFAYIKFNFNDVRFSIGPNADIDDIQRQYDDLWDTDKPERKVIIGA